MNEDDKASNMITNTKKRKHDPAAAATASDELDPPTRRSTTTPAEGADPTTTVTTTTTKRPTKPRCPYLDTIQRSRLDFDFEPSCSVSLTTGPHVYGCLVCGKYFRGKGPHTPAYTHAVECQHYVYVHLTAGTFWWLPEGIEISTDEEPALNDVATALHPTYSWAEIEQGTLDTNTTMVRDVLGRRYLPGYVGLNNYHKTDYLNSTIQALAQVRPIRDYFLRMTHQDRYVPVLPMLSTTKTKKHKKKYAPPHKMSELVVRFGDLLRKMWSAQRFKANVDPHMLLQAVSRASQKKYHVGVQVEVGEFMAWFLHQLHRGLGGTHKQSSIIYDTFQGHLEITTQHPPHTGSTSNENENRTTTDLALPPGMAEEGDDDTTTTTTVASKFLQLTLDIPEKPLFRDEDGGLVIPQEPLQAVLQKFEGRTFHDVLNAHTQTTARTRYRLTQLPPYLILHLARFKKNQYTRTKNPTIVAFPVKNLDLRPYTFPPTQHNNNNKKQKKKNQKKTTVPPTATELRAMTVAQLEAVLDQYGDNEDRERLAANADGMLGVHKAVLLEFLLDLVGTSFPDLLANKYDLVANITHTTPAEVGREGTNHDPLQDGSYKCHIQYPATSQWFETQDLHVTEIMPQLIGVSESYVLIFARQTPNANKIQQN